MKRFGLLICCAGLALSLAGCGSSGHMGDYPTADAAPSSGYGYDAGTEIFVRGEVADTAVAPEEYYEAGWEMDEEAVVEPYTDGPNPATGGGGLTVEPVSAETRKIVYTVDLALQTTDFEAGTVAIPESVEAIGGFIQDSYIEGTNMNQRYSERFASFTARVPVDQLDAFIAALGEDFHIVYRQKSSSDITGNYYDTQARLRSLRVQEERLQAMLETADELQYLLEVERELANVLYEIETMTSALNRMDASVSLSTVSIRLEEVNAYDGTEPAVKPVTFGERMQEAFGGSWIRFVRAAQEFLVVLVYALPFLILIAVILALAVIVVRRRRARTPQHPPVPPAVYPLQQMEEEAPEDEEQDPHE